MHVRQGLSAAGARDALVVARDLITRRGADAFPEAMRLVGPDVASRFLAERIAARMGVNPYDPSITDAVGEVRTRAREATPPTTRGAPPSRRSRRS